MRMKTNINSNLNTSFKTRDHRYNLRDYLTKPGKEWQHLGLVLCFLAQSKENQDSKLHQKHYFLGRISHFHGHPQHHESPLMQLICRFPLQLKLLVLFFHFTFIVQGNSSSFLNHEFKDPKMRMLQQNNDSKEQKTVQVAPRGQKAHFRFNYSLFFNCWVLFQATPRFT